MTLKELLKRIPGDKEPMDRGIVAVCPVCQDVNPCLYVRNGEKKIMLNCLGGCSYRDIMEALDIRPADLYYDVK